MMTGAMSGRRGADAGGSPGAACPGYIAGYRANYRVRFCSWLPSRPRQHWGLVVRPSPTTRPPRGSSVGWVAGSRTRACGDERCWRGREQIGSVQQPSGPNPLSNMENSGNGFQLQLLQSWGFGDGSVEGRACDLDGCRGVV